MRGGPGREQEVIDEDSCESVQDQNGASSDDDSETDVITVRKKMENDMVSSFLNCSYLVNTNSGFKEGQFDYKKGLLIQQLKEFHELYSEYVSHRVRRTKDKKTSSI